GAIKLADDTVKLPEGTVALPPGTVKVPFDGPAKYMDEAGNLYKEDGSILQRGEDAKVEKTPDTADGAGTPKSDAPNTNSPATVKAPDRVLAGVGGRSDDGIRLTSDISDPVHVGDHAPTGRADTTPGGHAPDGVPRNSVDSHTPSTPGTRPDTPSTGGASHADTPSTGGAGHADTPSTGGASHADTPSTGGASHADTPGGGAGHPDTPGGGAGHADGSGGTGSGGHQGPPSSAAPDDATRAAHHAEYQAAREVPPKERTAAERTAITREHVWLVNNDPVWRAEHYDKWGPGKRNSSEELVDGQLLPILSKQSDGSWISVSEIPYADPEKFHLTPLERDRATVPPDDLAHLDKVAARRFAGMELTKAEAAFNDAGTEVNAKALAAAQKAFDAVSDGLANNSKLGEALGEEAARRHMLQQKEFEGFEEKTDLPETPNGSKRFDQLWEDKDGNIVIVEAKAPNARLDWRQSNSDPVHGDPDNIMMVKQGTIEYVRTVVADMKGRAFVSPKDGTYARKIEAAMSSVPPKLRYVLVQAVENTGQYAGAELKYFNIF
ncbi:hypothetical protein ABZ812_35120, partial [Streptomyces sp. NPDC047718]